MNKMSKKELVKRYVVFVVSLFIMAMGVAMTKVAELGVSPISSVANVMSIQFTNLSIGNWLIIWNCVLILGQIILLRKKFQLVQLMQIPLSFLFGYFTDFGMWIMSFFDTDTYIVKMAFVIIGTIILGCGVALSVIANVVMNSGEAFVKALSDITHADFGNLKIGFDVGCVVISVILSLVFFDMKIIGTREGTIIAALFTGVLVKFFTKLIKNPLEKLILYKRKNPSV